MIIHYNAALENLNIQHNRDIRNRYAPFFLGHPVFSKTNINSPQLTLNNENIKRVHTHKHLGLLLTSNLDWSAQIHYVCLRANRKLAVIRKNKMLNRQTLDMLYKVTVKSVIDYGLPVYYQSLRVTEKTRLEQIQYRAAKIVTGVLKS